MNRDNTTFTINDAPTFRNVALISLGVGGFCSLLFHVIVKFESQGSNVEDDNTAVPNIENDEGYQEDISSLERGNEQLEEDTATVGPLQGNSHVNEASASPETEVGAHEIMKVTDWLRESQLYQVAFLYMCTRLFVNVSQTYMPLYLNVTLELPQMYVAIIPMVMYISGIFMVIVTKSISKRLGKKFAYGLSCLLGGTGCLWIHWGESKKRSYIKTLNS